MFIKLTSFDQMMMWQPRDMKEDKNQSFIHYDYILDYKEEMLYN